MPFQPNEWFLNFLCVSEAPQEIYFMEIYLYPHAHLLRFLLLLLLYASVLVVACRIFRCGVGASLWLWTSGPMAYVTFIP